MVAATCFLRQCRSPGSPPRSGRRSPVAQQEHGEQQIGRDAEKRRRLRQRGPVTKNASDSAPQRTPAMITDRSIDSPSRMAGAMVPTGEVRRSIGRTSITYTRR